MSRFVSIVCGGALAALIGCGGGGPDPATPAGSSQSPSDVGNALPSGDPNDPAPNAGVGEIGDPDLDPDGDSIPTADDQCPDEAETFNGWEDEDGCPDRGRTVVSDTKIEILDKVYFETDSAAVKNESLPLLDAIAIVLDENPSIRLVEIQGHADEQEADGQVLSIARAEAVKAALVGRKVDAARLGAMGYGPDQPIDARRTEAAWARNRRVEFLILKQD
jgi:outer membrane protein OmpA-like peptidoglycan-associated protein